MELKANPIFFKSAVNKLMPSAAVEAALRITLQKNNGAIKTLLITPKSLLGLLFQVSTPNTGAFAP